LNVHASASFDTFAEEIVDPASSRVFARSSFAYGHEPAAPVVEPAAVVVTVLQPELADVVPLPPQAATSNPTAISRTASNLTRPVVPVLIW